MIFIDTSFLLALLIESDMRHERALKIAETINERKVINSTVLNETLNAYTGKGGKIGKKLYRFITEMFEIKYLTPLDYENLISIYLHYDSSINYADCTILQTMIQNKISKIASFDSDFEKINGITIIN